MTAFALTTHDLGPITLHPLTAGGAAKLGAALAAITPWSVIGYPADRLTRAFKASSHR